MTDPTALADALAHIDHARQQRTDDRIVVIPASEYEAHAEVLAAAVLRAYRPNLDPKATAKGEPT
jgi:hypothetical protein